MLTEYKVGDTFSYEGCMLMVVPKTGCRGCALRGTPMCGQMCCGEVTRKDHTPVMYVPVEDISM